MHMAVNRKVLGVLHEVFIHLKRYHYEKYHYWFCVKIPTKMKSCTFQAISSHTEQPIRYLLLDIDPRALFSTRNRAKKDIRDENSSERLCASRICQLIVAPLHY